MTSLGRSLHRFASAGFCIAAGVYLLQTQAAEDSLIETIMHGLGLYFIGKGLYVWGALGFQAKAAAALDRTRTEGL